MITLIDTVLDRHTHNCIVGECLIPFAEPDTQYLNICFQLTETGMLSFEKRVRANAKYK